MAFTLLKCELVLIQLWLALILAQLLHALQLHVAMQAAVDPFDVSLHLLVELLETFPAKSTPIIDRLVQDGPALGLIRPSSRLKVVVPQIEPHMLCPPADLKDLVRRARYAQRNPHPRPAPFISRFHTQLLF